MILTLVLVCLVAAFALAGVHAKTAPIVAQQEAQALQEGLAQVLPGAARFEAVPAERLSQAGPAVKAAWRGLDGSGQSRGVVVEAAPSGYGGAIRMLVGIQPDGTVQQMTILAAGGETPGLGSKATEPGFVKQFAGLKAKIGLAKGRAPQGNEIQAVTGATISSTAVLEGVNQALAAARQLQEGGRGICHDSWRSCGGA